GLFRFRQGFEPFCRNWLNGSKPWRKPKSPTRGGLPKGSIPWVANRHYTYAKAADGMIDCAPSAATLSVVQAQGPMKKIILDDILGFSAYEIVREQFRQG